MARDLNHPVAPFQHRTMPRNSSVTTKEKAHGTEHLVNVRLVETNTLTAKAGAA